MLALNLPPCTLKIIKRDEKPYVFDILRKRYVALTPEEWVRQNFTHFLIEHKGYPTALLANEVSLNLNGTSKRCDSVLYNSTAKPRMIIEFKASHIELTQKVFDQISRYNMALHVDYLIVSNGLQHYCCRMNYETLTYSFLPHIPHYSEL